MHIHHKLELSLERELLAGIGLAEGPVLGGDVERGERDAVAGGELEGEGLALEIGTDVPVLAPNAAHGEPADVRSLYLHRRHITRAGHIADQHCDEEPPPVDREPHPALPDALHSAYIVMINSQSTNFVFIIIWSSAEPRYISNYQNWNKINLEIGINKITDSNARLVAQTFRRDKQTYCILFSIIIIIACY